MKTGTDALLLALRALGIKPGDEVITAANSFFATGEAIALAGAKPVLCDVDDDTLLINVDDAARRVTPKTKCIIPVHLFGQLADMDKVHELGRAHGMRVLEDSAQAHGATRGDWRAGSARPMRPRSASIRRRTSARSVRAARSRRRMRP